MTPQELETISKSLLKHLIFQVEQVKLIHLFLILCVSGSWLSCWPPGLPSACQQYTSTGKAKIKNRISPEVSQMPNTGGGWLSSTWLRTEVVSCPQTTYSGNCICNLLRETTTTTTKITFLTNTLMDASATRPCYWLMACCPLGPPDPFLQRGILSLAIWTPVCTSLVSGIILSQIQDSTVIFIKLHRLLCENIVGDCVKGLASAQNSHCPPLPYIINQLSTGSRSLVRHYLTNLPWFI